MNRSARIVRCRLLFSGSAWGFFAATLLFVLLSLVTLGLALPFWAYWTVRYFITRTGIEMIPVEIWPDDESTGR